MREIKVNELKEGMTTAVDVFSPKGQLILKRHQAVSAFDIAKFGFYNIASVYVEGSSAQEKEEWNKKYAIIKEKYRDSIDNLHEYMNDILSHRSYEKIEEILQAFEKAKVRLRANVNFDITMELMLLALK